VRDSVIVEMEIRWLVLFGFGVLGLASFRLSLLLFWDDRWSCFCCGVVGTSW